MPTIGLVMTTYNEEKVIKRCLESVLPFIDYYSIGVDLKTTDNTKKIIEETLKDKTGIVFDSPWNGFADARNQAFEHFTWEVDWYLIIDADMILVSEGFDKGQLDKSKSGYLIKIKQGGVEWDMNWVVNAQYNWYWRGVLHEFLDCHDDINTVSEKLSELYITHGGDGGARAKDNAMFKRDVDVFLNAMVEETDPFMIQRYTFYLANSYRDANMKKESIVFYRMRAKMEGWNQEIYLSHYWAGRQSNNPYDYINAFNTIPTRCDALVELLYWGIENSTTPYGMDLLLKGIEFYDNAQHDGRVWDKEGLFFSDREMDMHDWAAIALAKVGRVDEAKKITLRLMDEYRLNNEEGVDRLVNNLKRYGS